MNLLKGFKLFEAEKKPQKDAFVNTIKKQLGVPKKLWLGMPLLVSNCKLGNQMIREPTMFYVKDFDDDSVTIKNLPNATSDDEDGEIDVSKGTIHGEIEAIITKKDFYNLQEPQGMQAGGGMGGGMGGML
jgi:hypothetical protein